MQKHINVNVIIDYIMITVLSFASVLSSDRSSYLSLAICGAGLVLYTLSIWVSRQRIFSVLLYICEIMLAVGMCLLATRLIFYSAFMFFPYSEKKSRRILSALAALIVFTICNVGSGRAEVYIQLILIISIMLLILLIKEVIDKTQGKLLRNEDIIRVSAVNEMNFRKLNEELEAKSYMTERNARMEEREKIARNIHNAVGHTITSAIVALDASEALYDISPELAREKSLVAGERMKHSLEEIRRAVRVLDSGAEEMKLTDFLAMLEMEIVQFIMDTELKVRHNLKDSFPDITLPAEHAEFLHGAVAEALSNGIRHGGATIFSMFIECDRNHIRLVIADNGRNDALTETNDKEVDFDKAYPILYKQGFGLKKMEEYLKKCGGSMSVKYGEGFTLILNLTLTQLV